MPLEEKVEKLLSLQNMVQRRPVADPWGLHWGTKIQDKRWGRVFKLLTGAGPPLILSQALGLWRYAETLFSGLEALSAQFPEGPSQGPDASMVLHAPSSVSPTGLGPYLTQPSRFPSPHW